MRVEELEFRVLGLGMLVDVSGPARWVPHLDRLGRQRLLQLSLPRICPCSRAVSSPATVGFGVGGWGFRVWGVGCEVWGVGFGIWGLG